MSNKVTCSFDNDEMFGWIEDMASMGPRRPESHAGHKNEDYLADKLKTFGLESVRKEAIPIEYWEDDKGSLEVDTGDGFQPLDAQWIPYTAFTPEEGIEAPLVYTDPKKLFQGDDWRGKIVLTLTGVQEPGVTHNVVGEIPGESDEAVVLSCHHDSPYESPVEDASGCSVILALARHLAKEGNLKRKVIILNLSLRWVQSLP